MQQTPYRQKMELLGLEEHNLFEIAYSKIVNCTAILSSKYGKVSVLDERSFLLRTIKRMTDIMLSIFALFQTTKDRAAMLILDRSVIDLNATICFLFDYVKDTDERALRIMLFYLDGIRIRLKISNNPLKKRDPKYISEEEYNAILEQKKATMEADIKAVENLELKIKSSPLYTRMHPSIMKNASWRYKRIESKDCFTWANLYEIAAGDKNMAQFEQEYLSHYVHGVAISDIQYPSINETNPVFALNICCSILNHLEPIIRAWFPDDYNDLEEAHKRLVVDRLLENLPPESIREYLKQLESARWDKVSE